MSGNSFTLFNLPTDVIRMVVGNVGLLEVDNLRLIYPRWNTIVAGHFSDPNRRPTLKWFRWDNDVNRRTVLFRAARCQCEFFSHSHPDTSAIRKITTILNRCSKISNIELSIADFQSIKSALCSMSIDELTITGRNFLQPDSETMILDFLRVCSANAHPIHRLIFSSEEIILHLHTEFFIQSARMVTEIVISFSEPQTPLSNTQFQVNALRDVLNGAQQITARVHAENTGMNTYYRLARLGKQCETTHLQILV